MMHSMNNLDNAKIERGNKYLPVLLYFLMFFSSDTYLFSTNANYKMTTIPWYLMMGFILISIFRLLKTKMDIRKNRILNIGFVIVLFYVFLALYHNEHFQVAFVRVLYILGAMLFTMQFEFEDYKDAFIKAMSVIAISAIILEILVYSSHSLAVALPQMMNTADFPITTIGIAGIDYRNLDSLFIRNSGIFWEPGVFQMYLNLAIIMELFCRETVRLKYFAILTGGLIITFSTTGYIVYAWIIASYLILYKRNMLNVKSILIMIATLITVLVIVNTIDMSVLNDTLFGKLQDEESGSTIARKASVFVNIQMFFNRPITGFGMNEIKEEMVQRSYIMYGKSTTHNTNTLLYQFAAFGVIHGTLFTVGTYKFTNCLTKKKMLKVVMFIAIVLIYVGENLRSSMLPYLLIFYGYGNIYNRNSEDSS